MRDEVFYIFTDQQLRMLIEGKVIGDSFPYDRSDEEETLAHINRLFYRINRIYNVVCEAEWNHFGSGYASFVEFFCYWKKDCIVVEEINGMREIEIRGILLDISRLAPVAIMGEDVRYKTIRIETNEEVTSGHGSILDAPISLIVGRELKTLAAELQNALEEFDYKRLTANEMSTPLSFKTKIPTTYRNEHQYLVLDAIFYWED
ncbi:hypothetical protein [Sporosarcina sp. P3]|uniref:hypothetical protein n=1 Tax=Sporosarcina sp. P3 TaxID=2048245 RepID=UPI00117A8B7D|nr:hypothetical protein [Sporosarcina sp. P3]